MLHIEAYPLRIAKYRTIPSGTQYILTSLFWCHEFSNTEALNVIIEILDISKSMYSRYEMVECVK